MSQRFIMCEGSDGAAMLPAEEYRDNHAGHPEYVLASDFDAAMLLLEARTFRIYVLEKALLKIWRYEPGEFRKLQDEIDIWRIAGAALGPKYVTTVDHSKAGVT